MSVSGTSERRRLEAFGAQLRATREAAELTLRECARRARVSPAYLSRLESGQMPTPPSEDVLVQLAEVLDVSPLAMCHQAGRLPRALEAQLLADEAWFRLLVRARVKRVRPAQLLEHIDG